MTEKTEEGIKSFLAQQADRYWAESEQPYLLALVNTDLKAEGINYREILGDEKLKAFVRRTESSSGYRYVEHPVKKPRIGIVPSAVEFEFTDIEPAKRSAPKTSTPPRSVSHQERVVLNFLHALSKLDDDDLRTVTIPANVLVKLVSGR